MHLRAAGKTGAASFPDTESPFVKGLEELNKLLARENEEGSSLQRWSIPITHLLQPT